MGTKELKRLPVGIQTFSEIIEQDYLYIDKTEYYTGSRDPIRDQVGNVYLPDYPDYKLFMDQITYVPFQE